MTPGSTARTPSSTAAMTRACAAWALRPSACGCWAIPIRPCGGAGRPSRWPGSCPTRPAWPMRSSGSAIFHQFRRDVSETQEQAEALPTPRRRAGTSHLPGRRIGPAGLGAGRSEGMPRKGLLRSARGWLLGPRAHAVLAHLFPDPAGRGVWQSREGRRGARRAGGGTEGG